VPLATRRSERVNPVLLIFGPARTGRYPDIEMAHRDDTQVMLAIDRALDELVGPEPTELVEETDREPAPVMTESDPILARLLPPYAD
jgi:hypothetical protein